ncbi:MAG: methyltransferase domain-containing protein, partial [Spirochaetales bacterium]|nr:methyltransferase domain-containing protein [Spirochaetales bacterium]
NLETISPNIFSPGFLNLPDKVKELPDSLKTDRVLVSFGGEDKGNLSGKFLRMIEKTKLIPLSNITLVTGPFFEEHEYPSEINILDSPENLASILGKWDLVFTIVGLTCFEALHSGVPVILLNPSEYHQKISKKAELPEIGVIEPKVKKLKKLLTNPEPVFKAVRRYSGFDVDSLSDFILSLNNSVTFCRGCGAAHKEIIYRNRNFSFYKCPDCGLVNQVYFGHEKMEYGTDYFFTDYQKQYGKTYLEDFDKIKTSGKKRCYEIQHFCIGGRLLDIGCGYGPFLSAAADSGFDVYGIDISKNAADWVSDNLGFRTAVSSVEEFSPSILDVENFDVVSMWFVIEHLESFPDILRKINKLLNIGGVFAVATPNFKGITGVKNPVRFFEQNPLDHYTVWSPESAKKLFSNFGFTVKKVKCPVIHPERFFSDGFYSRLPIIIKNVFAAVVNVVGKVFKLGDTFEFYAVKTGDVMEDSIG